MSGGYILLHRGIASHHIFKSEPFCERMAWVWLLMQASYQPHSIRYYNKLITVGRGEVPTSFRKLSEIWQWSSNRVSSFLAILEQDGMISKKTDTGFMVITICNYEEYQCSVNKIDTPLDTRSETPLDTGANTPTETRADTNINKGKEIKERKIKESIYPPEFENFWSAYPKNAASKSETVKSYQRAIKEGASHDAIIGNVKNYDEYLSRTGTTVAHATTWLNQRRWEINYQFFNGIIEQPKPSIEKQRFDSTAEQIIAEDRARSAH